MAMAFSDLSGNLNSDPAVEGYDSFSASHWSTFTSLDFLV